MTLGNAAKAALRLIVWCRSCGPGQAGPAELAERHGAYAVLLDLPPKKWTGLGRHALSESWADVAQGRMQAAGIVKALDILEEVSAGLGAGALNPMVNLLGLEAVKEALHWRIIQTIAFAAHRGCNA